MKKINLRKKGSFKFPVKIILVSSLCLGFILLVLFFSYGFLTSSEYFRIKDSEYFAGQNIFKLNLEKAAQGLSELYPYYKAVVLKRLLPDRIVVDFKPRQAIARVRLSKYFYVDEEGVLFHPVDQEDDDIELPLIVGLKSRASHLRPGIKYNEDSLLSTLEFINNLNKDRNLSQQLKIKKINLANVNDVFLFTTTGCKINLGGIKSLKKDLSILQKLAGEINSDFAKIEYIDLRFREAVVKYK